MQTFKMQASGSIAEVEVAYAAQFKWADGTVEFMTDPDRQWQLFGISAEDRDKIKEAIDQHNKHATAKDN